jgi:hypothetical protein
MNSEWGLLPNDGINMLPVSVHLSSHTQFHRSSSQKANVQSDVGLEFWNSHFGNLDVWIET